MVRSLGLSQTQSYEDIKGPPSTLPGYPVTTSQCSAITKCYCISPRDILGSFQTGSNKPSAGIRPTLPKSGLQSCQTGGSDALSILSSITHLLPPTPKPVRSTCWLPTLLFALFSDATTFVFPRVSAKCFGPPSDVFPVFLPIVVPH